MIQDVDVSEIQDAIRGKYAQVARSTEGKFRYPTGRDGAGALGYDLSIVEDLPEAVLDLFCGVGNPFSLGPIHPGEIVLDVGCGAGFDLVMASRLVGPTGEVRGIDLTPEMVERAQENLRRAGVTTGAVVCASSEMIPSDDHTFDVVISNGALNLSPLKEQTFQEIYRVLKPGGRLQFADMVVNEALPHEVLCSLEAWSD